MEKGTKQTLITLSLGGPIGYYLYNKLVQSGRALHVGQVDFEPAAERTKKELSWRPAPVVEVIEPAEMENPTALSCPQCGQINVEGAKFCESCGALLNTAENDISMLELPEMEELPALELEEPALDLEVEEDLDLEEVTNFDELEGEDTSVQDLFEAVSKEEDAPAKSEEDGAESAETMDNVEPLHKVDNKDPSAKAEFKSIVDFFGTI